MDGQRSASMYLAGPEELTAPGEVCALAEEQEWIQQSLAGDIDAFEKLVRRYQRMVHALAFRMTGSMTETEDLAQEVMVQVYRQLGNFRQESKFSSWLYRVAMNMALNWKRRDQRREAVQRSWQEHTEVHEPADTGTLDTMSQEVHAALQKLPPKQRAAVVLTIYDGLSHAEAARVLGCSETTVSWRLFAARAKLKKSLTKTFLNLNHEQSTT